jgi:hypothetical protein
VTLRWRGESAANSSRKMPNSLLAGKIQGISPIRGLAAPRRQRKRARNQFLTGQFPTHPNREFFAALQGIKSGDQGNFRPDQGIPLSSAILGPLPCRKSDRPDRSQTLPRRRKGRRQMLEVAEADLELRLCPCEAASGMPQIARRARRRGTIGVPGLHDGAWSRRARPRCTELTVTGDRGFESSSLQRRVRCEPDFEAAEAIRT